MNHKSRANVPVEKIQLVVFFLGGEEFALPLAQVQEIIRPLHLRQMPNEEGWLEGVTTLRGELLPVLNLRKELGLDETDSGSRIIVARGTDRHLVGLLVDEASEVIALPTDAFEDLPEPAKRDRYGRMVRALAQTGEENRVLFVLDVNLLAKTVGAADKRPAKAKTEKTSAAGKSSKMKVKKVQSLAS